MVSPFSLLSFVFPYLSSSLWRFRFLCSTHFASFPVYLSFPLFSRDSLISNSFLDFLLFDPLLVDSFSTVCSSPRCRERLVFYPVLILCSRLSLGSIFFSIIHLYYAYLPYLLTSWSHLPPLLSYPYYYCAILYPLLFLKLVFCRL